MKRIKRFLSFVDVYQRTASMRRNVNSKKRDTRSNSKHRKCG
jgi:hypothetical protein